jgi:predicted glycogen debranching enzyme
MINLNSTSEWLETNGLGAFAMGTATGERTRRYHGLLMIDRQTHRIILVNSLEVWAQTPAGTFPLSTQVYDDGVRFPDGASLIEHFTHQPWPKWKFALPGGVQITQEVMIPHGHDATFIRWTKSDSTPVTLHVRPLLSGRSYHGLQSEDSEFDFSFEAIDSTSRGHATIAWQPYENAPRIVACTAGSYEHKPSWFRNFYYAAEQERGLDFLEDLASPGEFHIELDSSPSLFCLSADEPLASADALFAAEMQRRSKMSPLKLAASQYIVRRDDRDTIIAGYPWFTDWGRDTFIALRGLCLAGDQLEVAKKILLAWSETVSEGMLPNRFPDTDAAPEYNSVDASLWFVIAANEFLSLASQRSGLVSGGDESKILLATDEILNGYRRGTRHEIRMEEDGLIAAGEPGVQLTWMDAKVNDWVVTPRIGKPVEIQALWLNCLWLAGRRKPEWAEIFDAALPTFRKKFWNEEEGSLYDIIDVDHAVGAVDESFRPNQTLAVGGLPYVLIEGRRARSIVDGVEQKLWTPLGLRTLSPEDPNYRGQYSGGIYQRDGAYHQGTAWPWLLGPFVEAWLRVRGNSTEAIREAKQKFWAPIERQMNTNGLGHVSEIVDGDYPHSSAGCPFQAWSLSEYIRVCKPTLTGRPTASGKPSAT